MIQAVAEQSNGLYSVEDLNELLDKCPIHQETPLLNGDILVLDLQDEYSNSSYILCEVLSVTPEFDEEQNITDWKIGIKIITDGHKK